MKLTQRTHVTLFSDFWIGITIMCFYIISGLSLLLYQPQVWSDEAVYASIVREYHATGNLGVPIWQGLLPGVEQHALWNPPLYFWLLAQWLRILPVTLFFQRLLSLVLGGVTVAAWTLIVRQLFPQLKKVTWLIPVALSWDFLFMRAARFSRPEILILALASVSLYLTLRSIRSKTNSAVSLKFLGASILTGLCLLVHPYGVISLMWNLSFIFFSSHKNKKQLLIVLLVATSVPFGIWLLSLRHDWHWFVAQYSLAIQKKYLDEFWIFMPTRSQTLLVKVIFGLTQAVSLYAMYSLWRSSKKFSKAVATALACSWLMVMYGRMLWYAVYVIPLTYIAWLGLLKERLKSRLFYKKLLGVLLVLIGLNGFNWLVDLSSIYRKNADLYEFYDSVLESVPDNTSVYLSAAPEPYFAFAEAGRQNQLILYPALETSVEDYLAVLQQSEYVIYTSSYTSEIFGRFLEEYLESNVEGYTTVGASSGFSATVFKLKPVSERKTNHLLEHDWTYFRNK